MEIYQQIKLAIDTARFILIGLPQNARIDQLVAALTWQALLSGGDKEAAIFSSEFLPTENLKFIGGINNVSAKLPALKKTVIKINTKQIPLKEFSYQTGPDELEIYLEPEHSAFKSENVRVQNVDYKFDLIILLGVPNFTSLGESFRTAPDFFYTVPIINIDHSPRNERFGQINLVDFKKTSISELVLDLALALGYDDKHDQETARWLLTGILSETQGLRSPRVTPQLLKKISGLLNYQINLADINKNLFHSKTLNMLRLWGRVLARLKEDESLKLVWSSIPLEDFTKTRTTAYDLPQIIEELISSYTQARLILILWQQSDKNIKGLLKSNHQHDALDLVNSYSPQGSADLAEFTLTSDDLPEAEHQVLVSLEQKLADRSNS